MPRPPRTDPSPQRVLCLCGPPAVGKSTAAKILAARAHTAIIETGQLVAQILRRRDVHELSKQEQRHFRRDALSLVTGTGTTPLVRALRRKIRAAQGPLILVGVRNVSTIDGLLRSGTLHLRVLFLRAPLGLRARRYKKREGSNGLSYATLLKARTEAEHAAIERRADEIVKNGADLRSLELALAPSLRWLVGR